jgi:hypothetical protein
MSNVKAMAGVSAIPVGSIDESPSVATAAEAILPDPVTALAMSGDPGAELAALAVKSGEQQETNAQAARDAQHKMEVSDDNQQVADMRQKADDIRSGGIVEGVGMMIEGGASVGAALSSPKVGAALQGGGKVEGGLTAIGQATFKAAEANDDANAAAAKSASDQAKGAADDLHDAKKAGADFVSAAIDFYREYTSAQASASSAALHRA